ncbi:MAG: hypothetical protein MI924_36765 [Chloroflexales bacterium]|nr:hypothetical protein [Chloroflexales bacterium]
MSETTRPRARRQVVGRRPGLTPYYFIAEQTQEHLVLQSHPDANKRAGYRVMARGGAFLLLALLIFCLGVISGAQLPGGSFGSIAITTLVGGFLAGLGFLRFTGGLAVASTANQITVDAQERTITFIQTNRIARQRKQTLGFEQVARLRFRPRFFITTGLLSRRYRIMGFELVTTDDEVWLIDSAVAPDALEATAVALATLLEQDIEVSTTALGPARAEP